MIKQHQKCKEFYEKKIPVALQSKAWVGGRLIAGTAGSNPDKSTYVRLSCLLCDMYVKASAMS
jgi:hypothetical protein